MATPPTSGQPRKAATKTVLNEETDYTVFEKEERIFVTMKDEKEYEIIEFIITDSTITGTSLIDPLFPISWKEIATGKREKKIKINLIDVERIGVKKKFDEYDTIYTIFKVFLLVSIPFIFVDLPF